MITVTGANGFIGSVLAKDLLNLGEEELLCVDPVSLESRPDYLSDIDAVSFLDEKSYINNLENYKNTKCIFHMGACSDTTEKNESYLKENNTEYTKKLFQFCTLNKIPFIYASSGAVYGGGEFGFDDTTPPEAFKPLNLYGWSKLNFDVWALQQKETPPFWAGLRFFNVYGPNESHKENMKSVVNKAFLQINDVGNLKLFKSHNPKYKDGEQLRDFVYVKDITRWMIEMYERSDINSGIYNLGYGEARSWLDLAKNVFKNMNKELNIEWIDIPEDIREQYQYYTQSKMDKLLKQNLSKPQWPLEKGIEDYLQNYLLKNKVY